MNPPKGIAPKVWEMLPSWAVTPNWKTGKSICERFEASYIPEPNSGCWLWIGSHDKRKGKGYGQIDGLKPRTLSHRLSYMMFKSEDLGEYLVCHKCDNPACVNPDHLFLGTAKDNANDRDRKGRHNHGRDGGPRKIPIEDIIGIIEADGSTTDIGKRYGISSGRVSMIKRGLSRQKDVEDYRASQAIRNRSNTTTERNEG